MVEAKPFPQKSLEVLQEEMQKQFSTNAMGPVLVTRALLDFSPAKVVVVTSLMGSIGDNTSGSYHGILFVDLKASQFGSLTILLVKKTHLTLSLFPP